MWTAILSFFKKDQKIDNTYYEYMLDRLKGVNYSDIGSDVLAQKTNVYFCFLKQILAPDDYNNKKIDFQNEQYNSSDTTNCNKSVEILKNINDFIFIKKTPGFKENLWWLDIQGLPTKKQILNLWDFFKFDLLLAYSNYIIIFFWFCIFLFIGLASFDRARTLAIVNLGLFTVLFLIVLSYLHYTSKFKSMLQYSFINNDLYKSNTFYCFGRTGSPVILKKSTINTSDFLNLTKERLYAAADPAKDAHRKFNADLSGMCKILLTTNNSDIKKIKRQLILEGTPMTESMLDTRAFLKYNFKANILPVIGNKNGIKEAGYLSKHQAWLPLDQEKIIKINNTPTNFINFKHLSKIFEEVTIENYKTNIRYLKLKSTATINLWKMFAFNETLISSSFFLIFFATTIGSIFCFFVYCVGLHGDWQKRRLFFLKPMMYKVNFFKKKNLIKQYFNKELRKKWGGTGLQEAFSIETSKYRKAVTKPNFKNFFTLDYINQLKNIFYSRTPTTLIWVSFTLGWFLQPNTTIYHQIIGMFLVILFGLVYLVFRFDLDWKTKKYKLIAYYTLFDYKKFKDYLAASGASGDNVGYLKRRMQPYFFALQPFSGFYVFFVRSLFSHRYYFFWFYLIFSAIALTIFSNLYAIYGELKIPTKEEVSFFILLQFVFVVYLLIMKNIFIWTFKKYTKNKNQYFRYKFILTKIFSIIFYLIYTITACTLFYFYMQCYFFPTWQRSYVEFFYLFTPLFLLCAFFCNKEYFETGYGENLGWYDKLLACKHSAMNLLNVVYWCWLAVYLLSFPISMFWMCLMFSHAVGATFPTIYAYPYKTEYNATNDKNPSEYFFFKKTKIYVRDMDFQGVWSESAALLSSFICVLFLIAMPTSWAKNIFNFHLFQYGLVLTVIYVFLNIYKTLVFKINSPLLDLIINSFLFIGLSILVYCMLKDFYLLTTSFYILNLNPKIILILWVLSIFKYWPIFFKSKNYTSSIYFLVIVIPCSLNIFFNLNCYVVQETPTPIYLLFLWELLQLYKFLNKTQTKAITRGPSSPISCLKKKTTKVHKNNKFLQFIKINKLTEIHVTTKSWKKILTTTTLFFYLTLFSFEISMKLEYNWCIVLYSMFIIIFLITSTILFFSLSSFLLNGSIQEMQGALTKIRYARIFYYITLILYLLLMSVSVYFIIYSFYYLAI